MNEEVAEDKEEDILMEKYSRQQLVSELLGKAHNLQIYTAEDIVKIASVLEEYIKGKK